MTLRDSLLQTDVRPQVVAALADTAAAEVSDAKGLTGMALKTAYKGVSAAAPGVITKAIDTMLPEIADSLENLWSTRDGAPFGAHLAQHAPEATSAMLAVADRQAEKIGRGPLVKAYQGMRGKAEGILTAALPRIGATLERFAS